MRTAPSPPGSPSSGSPPRYAADRRAWASRPPAYAANASAHAILDGLRRESHAHWHSLHTQAAGWPMLSYLLHNVEASLMMASPEVMELYASLVPDPALRSKFLDRILREYRLTAEMLQPLFGEAPGARRPRLALAIQLRKEALWQLHREQVRLLG